MNVLPPSWFSEGSFLKVIKSLKKLLLQAASQLNAMQ